MIYDITSGFRAQFPTTSNCSLNIFYFDSYHLHVRTILYIPFLNSGESRDRNLRLLNKISIYYKSFIILLSSRRVTTVIWIFSSRSQFEIFLFYILEPQPPPEPPPRPTPAPPPRTHTSITDYFKSLK